MSTITLILFFIATSIHLYASLKQDKPMRNRTKPFILIFLLAFYCFSASEIQVTVVLALIFSWLGDVLLIPNGLKWFTAGGISFMVSHLFFILTYARLTDFAMISRPVMVVLPVLFIISSAIVFRKLKPYLPKPLFWPMVLYLLLNGGMNCFAWFRSLSSAGSAAIITALGALLFYFSDCSLFFVRFNKDGPIKTHFLVMLTYSLGEFLIVLGLILNQ